MRLRSIHFKDLLSIILLLFLMSSTTAYASIDGNVSYMESAQNISIFRFLSIATTVIALIAMWFMKQALVSRRSLVVGALLTVFGLLHVATWSVNYMVIGMGLISLSGVLLAYDNGISKMIYILGVLFISVFASIELGAGAEFIRSVGLLYIIGAGLFLFVPDERLRDALPYESAVPITSGVLKKELEQFSKVRAKVENSERMDVQKARKTTSLAALSIMLVMIIMLFFATRS